MTFHEPLRILVTRYAGAMAIIGLAALVRLWLEESLSGGGFMIFFVAVIVASWFGGLGPSLIALFLSVLVSAWLFGPSPEAPPEPLARSLAGLGIFFFTGLFTAVLSESLRAARRRAEAADRRKDEFLAILAHELRNPLAPISMALEVVGRPGVDEATVHWAHEMMDRQVRHLVRLVDDLLDVSRIARNKIELRKEAVELRTVVDRAVESVRGFIDSKQHELTVILPDDPVPLVVDPVRLAQVVANLLNNAAKYTPPGGQIRLGAQIIDGSIDIRVRDTGIGIAPEMLPTVFDLFSQAPSAAGAQGGLGIGLTLVKNLVELMGGSVEARSDGSGKGSEFVVRLPLAPTEVSSLAKRHGFDSGQTVPRRRIFVVDDNADAAQSLSELLRIDGHDVQTFLNAKSALEAAEDAAPDAILLDLGMPEMDGVELAHRLRSSPRTAETLLIAITGWGQAADRERTRSAGINHHLVKPVDATVLRELLAQGISAGTKVPL
jgi:signal transduction histidine kinase/ActR/RegA family two-component response regulator